MAFSRHPDTLHAYFASISQRISFAQAGEAATNTNNPTTKVRMGLTLSFGKLDDCWLFTVATMLDTVSAV